MDDVEAGRLLGDLAREFGSAAALGQVGALLACLLVAWLLARLLRWRAPEESPTAVKRGAAALRRVLFPLAAAALLAAARGLLAPHMGTSLLSVALALVVALAVIRIAVYLVRIAFPAARWLDASERGIAGSVWLLVALHLTGLLPGLVRFLDGIELPLGRTPVSLWTLLHAALWVAIALLIALWAGATLEARLLRAEGLHPSLRVVFGRLGKAVLLVVVVLVVLPLLGIDLTVLSVFGGALGVGLGLGLQKIASNYVSGFLLLLDRSVRIGDVITADNHHGTVTAITTRYVVLRAANGVEAIIPNDSLVTSTVLNHTYSDRRVRVTLPLQVGYGAEVEEVLPLLAEIAARHPRVLADPPPRAIVFRFGDNGVELELAFWIDDVSEGVAALRSEVALAVLREFRTRGIEMPVPQREVHLHPAARGAGCAPSQFA